MDNGLSEYARLIRYNRRKYPVIGQKFSHNPVRVWV
jgi:hypothetical protein